MSVSFDNLDSMWDNIAHDLRVNRRCVPDLQPYERVIYYVLDVVSVTCNAGIIAWVTYHAFELDPYEINEAARCFDVLNLPECVADLQRAYTIVKDYSGNVPDKVRTRNQSINDSIIDHEEEILHRVLKYVDEHGPGRVES